ncbi:MAG TPA: GNAT family N-acetyltransferase [Longimicrobiaceae bacterium]|nr:GNAT family N-acetyltransferase [Longimicrobiaceae bacterium]
MIADVGNGASSAFEVGLDAEIRLTRQEDLSDLEWFGLYTCHRALIREAFERQESGEMLMLLAEVNDFPAGQLWIDLRRPASLPAAYLWALRVFPVLRGAGLGSRLLEAAERALRRLGVAAVEIGVELDNSRAGALYERRGYRPLRQERERCEFTAPSGKRVRFPVDMRILRKPLVHGPARRAE